MKYLGVLVLGMLLGALVHREFGIWRAPVLAAPDDCRACAAVDPAPDIAAPALQAPPTDTPATTAPRPDAQPVSVAAASVNTSPVASQTATAPPGQLLIPVEGKTAADLTDTFVDARSQGRSHDAIDIMAQVGTPVLAVADGHVEKLFDSKLGGLTIYQFEPSGKLAYYYAHLQRYADGLAEKQAVRRGQVIGYVGSTGNASADAPHLHFAIFVLGPERRWWEGTAINPYPVLTGT